MITTHYLEIYPRETVDPRVECLCDRDSGFNIIGAILKQNSPKKFFITFRTLDGSNEKINYPNFEHAYWWD